MAKSIHNKEEAIRLLREFVLSRSNPADLKNAEEIAVLREAVDEWTGEYPVYREVVERLTDAEKLEEIRGVYKRTEEQNDADFEVFYANNITAGAVTAADEVPATPRRRIRVWYLSGVAASIILLVGAYSLGLFSRHAKAPASQQAVVAGDIAPGGYHAVLTLSSGKQIVLDSAAKGLVGMDNHITISKQNDGEVVYSKDGAGNKIASPDGNKPSEGEAYYNTLTTGRGDLFHVTLPDGTKVWLNSASTLRYPTDFSGSARRVEITGEGYFEVAKDEKKPFVVTVGKNTVTVLGTHFDVQAYGDEPAVSATLLQGSIKFSAGGDAKVLRPGERARAFIDGSLNVDDRVNVDEVTAWKDGQFLFDHTGLEQGMRRIARWYNIDVRYTGPVGNRMLMGSAPLNENLSKLIHILNLSGVECKLVNRTLIVTP